MYFFADLHGTLSPPVFLDRLGATLVNATRTPAKRLLWLGSAFFFLFVIVNALAFLKPLRGIVDKLQNLMGWPVIILGGVCLIFWYLGAWVSQDRQPVRRLFASGVVEAQFAAHTKNLKSRRRDQDAEFLAERVIDPELLLPAAFRMIGSPRWFTPKTTTIPSNVGTIGSRIASLPSCATSVCSIKITSMDLRCTAVIRRLRSSSWVTWQRAI